MLSRKRIMYKHINLKLQEMFKNFMFLFFDPKTHTKLYSNFQKLLKNTTTAPEKSGNKNVNLRGKYKGTKFPNESNFVARSQILMFRF